MKEPDHAAALAERYSSGAAVYEAHWAPVLAPASRRLVQGLDISEARLILDLGAGVGTLMPVIAEHAPAAMVIGADRSEGMLRRGPPRFSKVVLDAQSLPFRERMFDAVTMAFMLFHVLDPDRALREVHGALRKGGAIGLATWEESGGDFLPHTIWAEELDRRGAEQLGSVESSGERMNELAKVRMLVEAAGFRVERAERFALDHEVDPEGFLERRTKLGLEADRFRSLEPRGREQLLAAVRERLAALTPGEMTLDDVVLLLWAKRP